MALDKGLVQNISLRANGDQLLAPMRAFGREINKAIADLNKLTNGFSKGAHLQDNQLRKQVQLLQRMVGEASTLQNILTGAGQKGRNRLFEGLDEQRLGKQAMSASKLKRELDNTKSSADALEVRLAQLYKGFGKLADAGRRVGQRDLSKAMNTEEAIRQVRRLEQEIGRLDARQRATGKPLSGDAAKLRAELDAAQKTLLSRVQSPSRVSWTTEIAQVATLTDRLRQLTRAQQEQAIAADRAAQARRRSITAQMNLSEPQLLAQINRQSAGYSFTREQARGFNIPMLNRQIDEGRTKLAQYQEAMSKAMAQGRSQALIDRLGGAFERLKARIAEATAQKKAFDSLPESRMKAFNESLMGSGGLSLLGRSAAIGVGLQAVFAVVGSLQAGARHVIEFEQALANLQAIAGATNSEMKDMAQSIVEVGQNSRYSLIEITEAATQIAQAGFSAAETATVLRDAMTLATASGASPSEAVDTLTSSLGAFQLQASESGRVVDTLVNGLNRTKLSIQQVQAAVQYAGATAFENGMGFEELVAVSGSLANAGIRSGSTIGTGLRQLLVDLKTPTKDFQRELEALGLTLADVDVKSLGLAQVVENLTDAGFSAEAAYESFEVRAASSFLAFRNQIDNYDQLAISIAQAGAAEAAAAKANDTTAARWQQLVNSLNTLVASLAGPFLDAFNVVIDVVAGVTQGFTALNEGLDGLPAKLLLVAAGFAVGGPWGAAIAAVTSLVGELQGASAETERLTAASNEAQAALDSKQQTVNSLDEAIGALITREETLKGNHNALTAETITLTTRFEGLANQLDGTATSYDQLLGAMMRYRGEALRQVAETARGAKIAAEDERRGYVSELESKESIWGQRDVEGYRMRNNRTVTTAQSFLENQFKTNFSTISEGDLQSTSINTQAQLNNLRSLRSDNLFVTNLIKLYEERFNLIQQLLSAQRRITDADRTMQTANARGTTGAQQRDQWIYSTRQGVDEGLRANKENAGSGEPQLNQVIRTAEQRLEIARRQLGKFQPDSPTATVITAQMQQLEAEISRVKRVRAKEADETPERVRDKPGERLTSDQVAAELQRMDGRFRVTNTTRTAAQQRAWTPQTRNAAQAPHVTGNALDMAIVPGMNPMEVVAMLEGMGLEITEAPVQGLAGARYIKPNHGTGPHWHFAWKPKTTRFEQGQQQEATQAARDLQQLLQAQAGADADRAQSRVDTVLASAKGGSASIPALSSDFEAALADLRQTKLAEFDVKNPDGDLSEPLKAARALARKKLEEQIAQEAAEAHANLWRSISDLTSKELDAALSAAQTEFDRLANQVDQQVGLVEGRGRTMQNGVNRSRFGVGAAYSQGRDEFAARLSGDRQLSQGLAWQELSASMALDDARGKYSKLDPGSEGYLDGLKKIADAEQALLEIQAKRADLQRSINERTQQFADIPLKERLEGSVAAWAENSGAMDTWGKTIENSVGPALDMFTSQLATMFTSIVDGTATVKQALVGFIKAFAQFVMQIIAKALALMAVKAILGAFGLSLTNTDTGVVIGKKGSFNGGLVGANDNPRKAYNGGYVNRGVSTRDSANYDLAYGEYVVNNKSVKDLGLPFMEAINREGSAGLKKMGAASTAFTAIQAPKQETNVYVVADRKQAGMGPNDVLVTIHEDILQGGPTKKLIRQVAQGG